MILFYLWRRGLWRHLDREKWSYFLGRGEDTLFLSRAYPLWRSLKLWALFVKPRYAAAAATWLEYRVDLYEGRQG
jgi:hypothetical protein